MSELKEQRYIIEIAKVQGVAKAAENLFISQPALSKFLTRTEEMYGVQLFERVGKKMIPTYAGKQYLEYAKQMVELDQDFRNQIADIKRLKKGSLNIGTFLNNHRIEHHNIYEAHIYNDDILLYTNHVCRHTHTTLPVR